MTDKRAQCGILSCVRSVTHPIVRPEARMALGRNARRRFCFLVVAVALLGLSAAAPVARAAAGNGGYPESALLRQTQERSPWPPDT